ncbi:hypothetical protein V1281_004317 [Nitrobacteraceae bacterium AZCC 2161]
MPLLVIEEDMRAERFQNWPLGTNSHEMGLVGGWRRFGAMRGASFSKSPSGDFMLDCIVF